MFCFDVVKSLVRRCQDDHMFFKKRGDKTVYVAHEHSQFIRWNSIIYREELPNSSVHIPVHQSSRRKLGSALSIDKGYSPPEITGCPPPPPCSLAPTTNRSSSFEIENLLKTAEQVTGFCRSPTDPQKDGGSPTGSIASSQGIPGRVLTEVEKLRKVILELVDTETTYVKHLNNLREIYLEPLKKETFLSQSEINALFGNIQELVAFQKSFLRSLEEALEMEPEFTKFEEPAQFKNILFSLGNSFLYHANHFKLYSSFCASHSKAQKILHPSEGSRALQDFLNSRNPKQQHSCTLESYLIKPIQRILKYPLLLQQLKSLTDVNSEEHQHLTEALKGMEKVAEHINEMQRIHEEYGAIFDHLFRQHQKSCKQPVDLSPGDLLYYGGVEWLNISDFLGKIKKGLELHAMCFVFKTAVVFLCKERLRQKKKLMGNSSKTNASEVEIIRYQVLIPVTEVQVRASNMKDMDSHFLWELIHLKSQVHRRNEKVYHLSNSTSVFRNAFLRTIRQIIRESVRNMSIPSNRPLPPPAQASKTLSRKKSSRGSKASSSQDYDNLDTPESGRRERSKTVTEGVGLINAWHTECARFLGSPVWKPRDDEPSAFPLVTKSGRSTPAGGSSSERKGEELTGMVYLTPPASKKESQTMTIDRLIYQLKALS